MLTEMYACSVLFVCLFIHFACDLVLNVLVNQKGFIYFLLVDKNALNCMHVFTHFPTISASYKVRKNHSFIT